ncbi:hypothetical protein BVX98_04665 [bacterium F11]|nr:hypothetical protein BVX98_04665 [bacterium F11]
MSKNSIILLLILSFAPLKTYGKDLGDRFSKPFGFELGKTTLLKIRNKLGDAKIHEKGNAAAYTATICYSSKNNEVIEFKSGELGHWNLGFNAYLLRNKRAKGEMECGELPKASMESKNINIDGLILGITKDKLIEVIGSEPRIEKDTLYFTFDWQRDMTKDEKEKMKKQWPDMPPGAKYDVYVSIKAKIKNNRLVELTVWKSETF